MKLPAALFLIGVTAGSVAAQAPGDEARELARRAADRIRALQQEADRLAARERSVFDELRRLEDDRRAHVENVAHVEAALRQVTADMEAVAARVASLEAQRVAETPGLADRLVAIYKRGRGGYARLLFEAGDVRTFLRLSRGVAAVARLDAARIDAHRKTVRAEREALGELEARRAAVARSEADAIEARTALDRALAARNRLIEDLDRRRDLAAQYVGELAAAQDALEKAVSTLDADEPTVAALPLEPFKGDLVWPVDGALLSRFGKGPSGRLGTAIVRNGIEVAAPERTPVKAVHGGMVAFAGPFAGFGTLVIVDHGDNAYSLYGYLDEARAAEGARVRDGEIVGLAGTSPVGAHAVYFELRVDGRPVDPLQWLRSSP